MKTSLLLPHPFKKVGLILFPLGLLIWVLTQRGYLGDLIQQAQTIKVMVLAGSFFAAVFGLYCLIFSQERVEDEFIKSVRLKSFLVSSAIQFIFFLLSFLSMFIFHFEPQGDGGMVNFLLLAIILYWLVYLLYFNFSLMAIKLRFDEK